MLKLMGKKIFTIFAQNCCLSKLASLELLIIPELAHIPALRQGSHSELLEERTHLRLSSGMVCYPVGLVPLQLCAAVIEKDMKMV